MKKLILAWTVACTLTLGTLAGPYVWQGGAGGAFSRPENWQGGAVPPTGDPATVLDLSAATGTLVHDLGTTLRVGGLRFGAGTVTVSGTGGFVFSTADGAAEAAVTLSAGTATLDVPVAFEGQTAFLGKGACALAGTLSGAGAVRVALETADDRVTLAGDGTARTGATRLDCGLLDVTTAGGFGTGAIYACTNGLNGTSKGVYSRLTWSPGSDATLANDLWVGSEIDGNQVFSVDGGHAVTLAGTVHVCPPTPKLLFNGAARLEGALVGEGFNASGNLVLTPAGNATKPVVLATPPRINGGRLWSGGMADSRVVVNVACPDVGALTGWGNARFVCGLADAFPARPNVFAQNAAQAITIDLNGFDQAFGGCQDGSAAKLGVVTFLNSTATRATLTLNQTVDHATCGYRITGLLNLVSQGTASLTVTNTVSLDGTLTVRNGTLTLADPAADGTPLATRVVVEAGGTLDLNGATRTCTAFELNGGTIQNGTLRALTNSVTAGRIAAALAGHFAKTGAGTVALDTPLSDEVVHYPPAYAVPEGTVAFYSFDEAEGFLADNGPNGYDLTVGRAGVVATNGIRGGGLYFDRTGYLERKLFPPKMPTGMNSFSVGAWLKVEAAVRDAMTHNTELCLWGYGVGETYKGNSMAVKCETGDFRYHNYWNNHNHTFSCGTLVDGDWHHVCEVFDAAAKKRYAYVDGKLVDTKDQNACQLTSGVFRIGASANSLNSNMHGFLDEVLFVSRALAADEVQDLYAQHVPRTEAFEQAPDVRVDAGTVAVAQDVPALLYRFDSAETLLKDDAPGGHDLVVAEGEPAFSDESPYGTGGSLYLKGGAYLKLAAYPDEMPRGRQSFTMGSWVRVDRTQLERYLSAEEIGWLHVGGQGNHHGITHAKLAKRATDPNLDINFYWNDFNVYGTLANFLDGAWHHVVTTWDEATKTRVTYYDGKVHDRVTASDEVFDQLDILPTNVFVGKGMNGAAFYGWLDEVAFFPRALTQDEVRRWQTDALARMDVALRVVGRLSGTGTVAGTLELGAGATVMGAATPLTVEGTVTFEGAGTFVPPGAPTTWANPAEWPLFAATAFRGTEHLAAWTVAGAKPSAQVSFRVKDGVLTARVSQAGMLLIVR